MKYSHLFLSPNGKVQEIAHDSYNLLRVAIFIYMQNQSTL